MKLVRTGHTLIDEDWDKAIVGVIEKLAKKKNIYGFYFDKELRDLIPE